VWVILSSKVSVTYDEDGVGNVWLVTTTRVIRINADRNQYGLSRQLLD
jgi:hypothetical protein